MCGGLIMFRLDPFIRRGPTVPFREDLRFPVALQSVHSPGSHPGQDASIGMHRAPG